MLVGFALAFALAVGCSLNPTPPNPHLNDPDPAVDHLVTDTDASDLDAGADAAEDAP